jgi:predicted ATPase
VFLRSLTIKNYRSLEDVRLNRLDRFNVLIGRNNSGKSSVFGALQFLYDSLTGSISDSERVLTDLDPSRSLEVVLTFEPRQQDREELIDLVSTTEGQKGRRADILSSPLLRQIEYSFKAPVGRPHLLHLRQTRVLAEDNSWAVMQRMFGDESVTNPNSTVVDLDSYGERMPSGFALNESMLDVDHLARGGLSDLTREISMIQVTQDSARGAPTTSANVWPQTRLVRYLREAFFFDPFRHSIESAEVQQTDQLSQDGSNLAQVLHTINSNDRSKFREIEHFVQEALPDVGVLQTPLENTKTRVSFLRPPGRYSVRLYDMGGGIEQLLMVATVLQTTGDESTLVLEEPESHLHAGAQRFLIERLYTGDRQVFVATHSPTFVNLSRRRSLYQIAYAGGSTIIDRMGDADSLGEMLEDIGARNSDVLLSDAVLFVEGPGDRGAFYAWSETLRLSLEESNVTVLPMGGGDYAEGKARVRSEILEGISERAPVPHLLVLDSDERSLTEIEKLQRDLGDKVALLKRREIDNYLMVPRALLEALRRKHANDAPTVERIEDASIDEVQKLIETTADSLYGVVLLKRIRAALEGLKGGVFPRYVADDMAPQAHRIELPKLLRDRIRLRVSDYLDNLDLETLVGTEREALDREWSDPEKRLQLAPGEEILATVFNHFGSEYKKPGDTVRIAKAMHADEIPLEVTMLINRAVSLPAGRE